jgi:hypothetical protein
LSAGIGWHFSAADIASAHVHHDGDDAADNHQT